jgi:hypothetical protein
MRTDNEKLFMKSWKMCFAEKIRENLWKNDWKLIVYFSYEKQFSLLVF